MIPFEGHFEQPFFFALEDGSVDLKQIQAQTAPRGPKDFLHDAAHDALRAGMAPAEVCKIVKEAAFDGLPGHGPKDGADEA